MKSMMRCSAERAFTLIEMLIALGVFLLLAGAVFGILTGILQSASLLQDSQNHRDQTTALHDFLAKKLRSLPAQSSLVSYRRGMGAGLPQTGIVWGGTADATALEAQLQANGYYLIRLGRASGIALAAGVGAANGAPFVLPGDAIDEKNSVYSWTPLIRDVKMYQWQFRDFGMPDWADRWSNFSSKPEVVELSLQLAGELHPDVMDFWIPRLQPVSLAMPSTPATNAP